MGRRQLFQQLLLVVLLQIMATLAWCSYADLDDQSGGIAEGFGSWGPWSSIKEPGYEIPEKGIITVYHPDSDPGPRPTIFFISGWGKPAETYEKFFNFLVSQNCTVVNIYNYNPGSINTSYPNALEMIAQAAEDFSPWINTDAVGLMGHSFGGGAAIWLGNEIFGQWNWGTQGRRFIFTSAPWLTFLTTAADLAGYPADTKLHIQISYDDLSSSADYVWNTDPRAIRAVYELINIPVSEKDFVTVHSAPDQSYEFNGDTYTYDADHYLVYTGVGGGQYEPYDALDVLAVNRLAHAMVEYVFHGNMAAKNVALGSGSPAQTDMGFLPALEVSDTPVITRDESLFAYRCSESEPGTWGDPDIWLLQDFCEDSDGDGIIDELEVLTAADEWDRGAFSAILSIGPNPFNPRTAIDFEIVERGSVSLRIYNLAGELVRTLADENFQKGHYSVQWNGCDDRGLSMSSGQYFVLLKTRNNQSSQAMVLIR